MTGDRLLAFALRLIIVVPFVAVASTWYNQYVVVPVDGFPVWFQNQIGQNAGMNTNTSNFGAFFDSTFDAITATADRVVSEIPWSLHLIGDVIAIRVAQLFAFLAILLMFAAYSIPVILVNILLVLGPLLIPFILFDKLAGLFWGWVWCCVTAVLTMVMITIVLALYESVIIALIQTFSPSGNPAVDAPGFFGIVLIIFLFGLSAAYVPRLASRIGGGVETSMSWASWGMTGILPAYAVARTVVPAASRLLSRL